MTPSSPKSSHQGGKKNISAKVYSRCMSRTNVDIDDAACSEVMRRFQLATKKQAVNLALRTLAAEPMAKKEARSLRGSGWDGSLEVMRATRSP